MTPLRCDWIHSVSEFHAISDEWDRLANLQTHRAFFDQNWFNSVLQWQPKGAQLCIALVKHQEQLIGILPLRKVSTQERGLSIQKLEWLAVPDTQFCDVIAKEEDKARVFKTFWKALSHNPFPWDKIDLYPFNKACCANKQWLPEKHPFKIEEASQHYWINLEKGWDDYYQTRTRRLKKGNNHLANRLKAEGSLTLVHLYGDNNGKHQTPYLKAMERLSEQSWKKKTHTTLENQGPQNFMRALIKAHQKNNLFSLWILKLNEVPIAFEYQIRDNQNCYALRSDFDEKYRALSPGSYLNWKMLESLEHCKAYYMGPGTNAYKLRWQNEALPLYRMTAYASNIKSKLLRTLNDDWLPKLRPLKNLIHQTKLKGNVS